MTETPTRTTAEIDAEITALLDSSGGTEQMAARLARVIELVGQRMAAAQPDLLVIVSWSKRRHYAKPGGKAFEGRGRFSQQADREALCNPNTYGREGGYDGDDVASLPMCKSCEKKALK